MFHQFTSRQTILLTTMVTQTVPRAIGASKISMPQVINQQDSLVSSSLQLPQFRRRYSLKYQAKTSVVECEAHSPSTND